MIQAAKDTMDSNGFGMSFVRFICGAQDIHKTLEKKFLISMGLKIRFYMLAYELVAIFKLIVPDGFFPFGSNGQIIRVQLSTAHSKEHLDKAIEAFVEVGKTLTVI